MSKFILFSILILLAVIGGFLSILFLSSSNVTSQVKAVVEETPEVATIEKDQEVKVPILIYHHVRQLKEEDATSSQQFIVFPENFENQIKYLQDNNFNSISFNNLTDYFDGSFVLPENPIIITFDDGVINQYENAFPILQKYEMTATFFIFPNPLGGVKII